jgi:hypothetical protein
MMNILLRRIAILLLLLIVGTVSQASGTDGAPTPVVSVATINYSNGDFYRGNIDDNGLKNGYGKYTWANGDVYVGEYKDALRSGKGKYTWPDGRVYYGDWLADKMHGKGKYTWANGDVYVGEYKDNLKNGKGKYTWANGDVYDGEFLDGFGLSAQTGKWKAHRHQGEWSNNKMHGKGAVSWFWNLIEVKGEWKNGWLTSIVRVGVDIGIGVVALANRLVHVICSYHYFGFHHVLVLAVWTILWEFLLRDLKGAKSNKEPTDGVGIIHIERDGTGDTDLVVRLNSDHNHCGICYQAFTTDTESTDQTSQNLLPVMGPCGHYFCRGCIIASQYMVAPNGAMGCPMCNRADQFYPEHLVHHRMLIDLLHRARPLNDFLNRARHIGTAPADEEA